MLAEDQLNKDSTSSARAIRPQASMTIGWMQGAARTSGAAQSVHSRIMAKLPRSGWRRLSVSTPETLQIFRTRKRCPRRGWNGCVTSAEPKGWRDWSAVRCDCALCRRQTDSASHAAGSPGAVGSNVLQAQLRLPTGALRPPSRGPSAALHCRGYSVVVDLDLEKFFDRVNHDSLMARVAARVTDKRVLKLIRAFLKTGVMEDGLVRPVDEGTPQGGPLTPLTQKVTFAVSNLTASGRRSCSAPARWVTRCWNRMSNHDRIVADQYLFDQEVRTTRWRSSTSNVFAAMLSRVRKLVRVSARRKDASRSAS